MTIDEAIEADELIVKYPKTPIGSHTLKGIKLGIEALKRVKRLTPGEFYAPFELLPGETKD